MYIFHYLILILVTYICVYFRTFLYICVYFCIFALIFKRCAARFATKWASREVLGRPVARAMAVFVFSLIFHWFFVDCSSKWWFFASKINWNRFAPMAKTGFGWNRFCFKPVFHQTGFKHVVSKPVLTKPNRGHSEIIFSGKWAAIALAPKIQYSAGTGVVVEIVLVLVLPLHVLVLVVWLYCCTC